MKRILNLLLVTLFAAALTQFYCAHMELKSNYEALAWQMQNKTQQFDAIMTGNLLQTRQDAQKVAELEAQIAALTAGANRAASSQ